MNIFTDSISRPVFLGSVFLTALLCLFTDRLQHSTIPWLLIAGLLGGSLFFFSRQVTDGFIWLWNEAETVLGKKAGVYITAYQQNDTSQSSQMIFLVFLGIVAAMAGFFFIKARLYPLLFLWAVVLPVFMTWTDTIPDTGLCLAFYYGIILELNYTGNFGKIYETKKSVSFLSGILIMTLLATAGTILLKNLLPQTDYENSQLVSNAKEEAAQALSDFRYKGTKINSLPNGNLKEMEAQAGSDEIALLVTMENPSSLYLKGFVGSDYNGSSWTPVSTENAYNEKNLFYWLHQDGFYGETQLNNVWKLLGDSQSDKSSKVTVKNEKASSKYLYLPYEADSLPEGYEGESPLTDSTLAAKGFFGQREYNFYSSGNLVKEFTSLSARIYQALSAGESSSYHEEESYYNTFAYKYNTTIPGTLKKLFSQELGDGGNRQQGHTDYYTAISRIRAYLEKNMTYSTAPEPFTGTGDFTEHFLTETKIGNSVHFATAATLMFRYYGIPARYVEGYLITPEDVDGKKAGDTILVPGKNAHAWTEIYVDGLGWIPLEMTPAYYGVMEEADLNTGLEAKGQKAVSLPQTDATSQTDENIKTHWSLKLALFGMEKFLLLLLLIFDIFCLIFMVTVIILRLLTNYKRKKGFRAEDNRLAVRALAGYANRLYERGVYLSENNSHEKTIYSDKTIQLYEEICKMGKKAAFSPHEVTKKERRDAFYCVRVMLKELKKARSWYDKWIMKYIERLY